MFSTRLELVSAIRSNRTTFITFLKLAAHSRTLAKPADKGGIPNTHKFIASIYNAQDLVGWNNITDKQKVAVDSTIRKYADVIFTVLQKEGKDLSFLAPEVMSDEDNEPELDDERVQALVDKDDDLPF